MRQDKLLQTPDYYRGLFISRFALLEMFIDTFICRYFELDDKKSKDLVFMLLNRMTFEAKRTTIKTILERHFEKKGFVKTKNNKWPFADVLNEIRLLNDHRICFAHYATNGGNSTEDNLIELVEYRDKMKTIIYSKVEYDKIIRRTSKVYAQLLGLIDYDK